jgi:hypothetical protein
MAKHRNRASSRAHTSCPHCQFKVHGERGLKMHLKQVHGIEPKAESAEDRISKIMGRAS